MRAGPTARGRPTPAGRTRTGQAGREQRGVSRVTRQVLAGDRLDVLGAALRLGPVAVPRACPHIAQRVLEAEVEILLLVLDRPLDALPGLERGVSLGLRGRGVGSGTARGLVDLRLELGKPGRDLGVAHTAILRPGGLRPTAATVVGAAHR